MNNHEALVSAAVSGLGIIQVASYYAYSRIQSGELVEILKGFKSEGHIISAVFSKQQPFPPKIRAFVDFLVQQFIQPPWNAMEPGAARRDGKQRPARRAKLSHGPARPAANRGQLVRDRKPNARA
jgi:hypothetical protein